MVRLPSSVKRVGRDHSLIALGIVLAVLLAALLALPFITPVRGSTKPTGSLLSPDHSSQLTGV